MKRLRYIAAIIAVLTALLMSVDESISLYANVNTTHIPFHSDGADAAHHHTISLGDHFFQKNSISFPDTDHLTRLQTFFKTRPEFSYFLSSIWQPPKYTC